MANTTTWKEIKSRIDPLNLNKGLFEYRYDDLYEMPIIHNDCKDILHDNQPIKLHPFKEKPKPNTICHFFLDDYHFERVWNQPKRYIQKLSQYDALLSPDFSLFTDYPMPVQIWNTYRNRWLGAYWQSLGMKVIPTIVWSTSDSFDFCFNGVEKDAIVAVSTQGCLRNKDTKELFMDGYDEMVNVLSPSHIVVYGSLSANIDLHGNIIFVQNPRIEQLRKMSKE